MSTDNSEQTAGQTDGRTNNPKTRCPLPTIVGGGIKMVQHLVVGSAQKCDKNAEQITVEIILVSASVATDISPQLY